MTAIKFIGYWGDPHCDEQMGLTPGRVYEVIKVAPCNADDPSSTCCEPMPFIINNEGKLIELSHGEFEEV